MTSLEIARIYTEVVALHDAIPDDESTAKDAVAGFRSNLHYTLMDAFRSEGVEFGTRDEAARIAFGMVRQNEGNLPAKGETD